MKPCSSKSCQAKREKERGALASEDMLTTVVAFNSTKEILRKEFSIKVVKRI